MHVRFMGMGVCKTMSLLVDYSHSRNTQIMTLMPVKMWFIPRLFRGAVSFTTVTLGHTLGKLHLVLDLLVTDTLSGAQGATPWVLLLALS